jgi:hypothetical protein
MNQREFHVAARVPPLRLLRRIPREGALCQVECPAGIGSVIRSLGAYAPGHESESWHDMELYPGGQGSYWVCEEIELPRCRAHGRTRGGAKERTPLTRTQPVGEYVVGEDELSAH